MVRAKTVFICKEYGYEIYKWMGKCPDYIPIPL